MTTINVGLSPRVRGNRVLIDVAQHGVRSIPACAGEPAVRSANGYVRRSIPACAGEPGVGALRRVPNRVVCGGTDTHGAKAARDVGLSPRVRGNHLSKPAKASQGLSPRVRGNRDTSPSSSLGVYPRVCGGTSHRLSPLQ